MLDKKRHLTLRLKKIENHIIWVLLAAVFIGIITPVRSYPQSTGIDSLQQYYYRTDQLYDAGNLEGAVIEVRKGLNYAIAKKDLYQEASLLLKLYGILIELENNINTDSIFQRVNELALITGNDMLSANLNLIKARQLMYNQDFFLSRIYYEKADKIFQTVDTGLIHAYYFNDRGFLEASEGFSQKALDWYFRSYKIFDLENDSNGLANLLGNIATVYADMQDYVKAIRYAEQSIDLRRQTNELEGLALMYGKLSDIYFQAGMFSNAQSTNQKFLHFAKQSQKKKTIAEAHSKMAFSFAQQNLFTEAIESINTAICTAKIIHHPELSRYYNEAAKYYGKIKDTDKADKLYEANYILLKQSSNLHLWRNFYKSRAENNKLSGRWQQAVDDLEWYNIFKDSILNEKSKKIISELEIEYESNKKDLLIQEAKNVQIQQRFYYNIALSLAIISGLGGLVIFNRYKFKKRIEQKNILLKERNRISSELHDDLGSTLSAIRLISYAAVQNNSEKENVSTAFGKIHSNTQTMMDKLSDIVWSMHPDSGILENAFSRMNVFASDIFEAANIAFHFTIEEKTKMIQLSPELLRDFLLLFKEAVNNIAKHSFATQVSINIKHRSHILEISISDNGIGIPTGNRRQGNGIRNMHNRCQKHNGKMDIQSSNSTGTQITFTIPYTL